MAVPTTITGERLIEAMRARGISQSELARRTKLTQGAIYQIITGATKKSAWLPDIARELGVPLDWLQGSAADETATEHEQRTDTAEIIELDIGYGMGGGTFIEEQNAEQVRRAFDLGWLRDVTRSPPQMLFLARGIGDSMMTTLLDNDTLMFDRGFRAINQQDRIWALTYGELGMVKRVRRRPDGVHLLMSDNPAISPIEAVDGEFNVVGRLIWIGRKA